MSFSSDIKEKLCAVEFNGDAEIMSEIAGAFRISGVTENQEIRFSASGEAYAKRLSQNIEKLYNTKVDISRKGNNFLVTVRDNKVIGEILSELLEEEFLEGESCENAFLRGAFLSGGSVSDPEKSWHIEFDTHYIEEAEFICELLEARDVRCGISERKGRFVVYSKDCDSIATILGSIGAGADALQLFEIQVERRMRNDINRRINFESANLDKSIKAASKHIHAVKLLKAAGKWEDLPDVLKEIGEMRVENPDVSLKQLGEMLDEPIGKSGVNHRLNRLLEAAEGIGE